jgi:hypothetical protein
LDILRLQILLHLLRVFRSAGCVSCFGLLMLKLLLG